MKICSYKVKVGDEALDTPQIYSAHYSKLLNHLQVENS